MKNLKNIFLKIFLICFISNILLVSAADEDCEKKKIVLKNTNVEAKSLWCWRL